jgi:hypothetical protein
MEARNYKVSANNSRQWRNVETPGVGRMCWSQVTAIGPVSVTAALRYLFALARRFRFEGFGIRAAIHANPDLLSTVRALVIVCAAHAPNCALATPTRRAILFLTAISSGLPPLFNIRHATQKPRPKPKQGTNT